MLDTEREPFLALAKSWETAADLHEKAMRRNRSFAKEGTELYDFYLSEAARHEIRAKLYRSQARELRDLLNQIQAGKSLTAVNPAGSRLKEVKNSATGL